MARKRVFHLSLCTFLITSLFFRGFEAGVCPENWIQNQNSCFGVILQKLSWPEAEIDCQTYGKHGHLASFQTKSEWDLVAKYVVANFKDVEDIWVGLEDSRRVSALDSGPQWQVPSAIVNSVYLVICLLAEFYLWF
nr:PREDICTED: regenerating islet-derived protein 4 [Anolis carolinensis]|eukprot:XP_008118338.1 PREDICTED: regenerating islet-derived protein 4 [Anolis carolinensis]